MSLHFQTSLRQRRGDIHPVFGGAPFVGRFVEGIAGCGLYALRFSAIHCQQGTLAISAKDKSSAAGIPLGERGADDRSVCGGTRHVIEC